MLIDAEGGAGILQGAEQARQLQRIVGPGSPEGATAVSKAWSFGMGSTAAYQPRRGTPSEA